MIQPLKIIIAGGGIGGAAAALALLRKGYDVEVYEQAAELGEVGAGVQISPNGSRALDYLGVLNTLKDLSCAPERKEFRLWNTGDSWPMFDLGARALDQYGFPYLTVYRPDLLATLVDAVRDIKPDAFHLGSTVVSIHQDADCASLTLQDGTVVSGDLVIGADGVKSSVRRELWGPDDPRFAGMIAWRAVIPMKDLPEHMQKMVGSTWIGPGGHVVNYPLRDGTLMNFVGTIERDDWEVESWRVEGTEQECLNDFDGWHEDVRALIKSAPVLLKWAFGEREPMQQWSKGRISLLGDACHPTLPFLAQGAVMAIEDGVVLSRCLEKYAAQSPQQALLHFEAARVQRTSDMVLGARANTDRFHSAELVDKVRAEEYLTKEMGADPLHDRYHWLYIYDVATAEI
jgi:salicylate hydroxylase